MDDLSCVKCLHCKVKAEILAYCELGHWQKGDGKIKTISSAYLPYSRLASTAMFCADYKERKDDHR